MYLVFCVCVCFCLINCKTLKPSVASTPTPSIKKTTKIRVETSTTKVLDFDEPISETAKPSSTLGLEEAEVKLGTPTESGFGKNTGKPFGATVERVKEKEEKLSLEVGSEEKTNSSPVLGSTVEEEKVKHSAPPCIGTICIDATPELNFEELAYRSTPLLLDFDDLSLAPGRNQTLEEAIRRLGTIYTKNLVKNLKTKFPLIDLKISFKESPETKASLMGDINLKLGTLLFNTSLEMLGEPAHVVNGSGIEVYYNYYIEHEILQYRFIVDIPLEQMKGTFVANLRDTQLTAKLTALREQDGTCGYFGSSLVLAPNFKKYDAIYNEDVKLESKDSTKKVEAILNTFMLKYVFINKKIPLIYDALERVHEKIVPDTGRQFRGEMGLDLCQYILWTSKSN